MVTNETKNGRKFIKMYDPKTGEYLRPFVNMTHEEAHGKKPKGTLEIKIDKEVKELARASKNAAEIFCRITDCTYDAFNRYAEKYTTSIPTLLPNIVKSSIVTISCVSDLSEISLNVPLLVYALYYERYNNSILPSSQMDIVFDIVSAMLELKKEGIIQ